jgi:hypothetical protein
MSLVHDTKAQEKIDKLIENPDVYTLDEAIEKYEDYRITTQNQIRSMEREMQRAWHTVQVLKKCRKHLASLPKEEPKGYEKI